MTQRYRLAPLTLLLLAGCAGESETTRVAGLLYRYAFEAAPRVTRDEAAAVPFASLGMSIDDGPQAMLILGGDTGDVRNWYGGQQVAIATRQGRIVKTAGLPFDLGGLQEFDGAAAAMPMRYALDFPDLGIYGAIAECSIADGGEETVEILGTAVPARLRIEHCRVARMDWSFDNSFWVGSEGEIWRSRQHVHPKLDPIVLETLRPVAAS